MTKDFQRKINDLVNPPRDHIDESHWHSLKRSEKVQCIMSFTQCAVHWQTILTENFQRAFQMFEVAHVR